MEIAIQKGLDIPIAGKPAGFLQDLPTPKQIALPLDAFEEVKFRLLVKTGDYIQIGQPLLENKSIPGQFFVSPACGVLSEIKRGLKRRLIALVIDLAPEESFFTHHPFESNEKSKIFEWMLKTGLFPHIRMRPFNLIASPLNPPKSIFVKAIESAPFLPEADLHVVGFENFFQKGLDILSKIAKVHLVYKKESKACVFKEASGVQKYSAIGPHPIANPSLHIHLIDPIRFIQDVVWTIDTIGVITLGKMALLGKYHIEKIISISGNGVLPGKRGFYKGRTGYPIKDLVHEKIIDQYLRLISGSPICGQKVDFDDFLGFFDTALSIIPENLNQELFHFLRLGLNKYSATRAYLSGHRTAPSEGYEFTTNQHGEERAFIDGSIYNKVMPMKIPTMQLIKAILAEDFELAQQLGLLEVDPEDFALPSFICPSKIEMMEIVRQGQKRYAKESGVMT